MKYFITLLITTLMSCQRIKEDTVDAEQMLHDLEAFEDTIAKDSHQTVYTIEKGNP